MQLSPEILSIGAITGLIYALLAAGLVLVYRSTGIINFAYGELGALCAAVLAKLVDIGWNFWPALGVVIALGAVLGGLIELLIVRRLNNSPSAGAARGDHRRRTAALLRPARAAAEDQELGLSLAVRA